MHDIRDQDGRIRFGETPLSALNLHEGKITADGNQRPFLLRDKPDLGKGLRPTSVLIPERQKNRAVLLGFKHCAAVVPADRHFSLGILNLPPAVPAAGKGLRRERGFLFRRLLLSVPHKVKKGFPFSLQEQFVSLHRTGKGGITGLKENLPVFIVPENPAL